MLRIKLARDTFLAVLLVPLAVAACSGHLTQAEGTGLPVLTMRETTVWQGTDYSGQLLTADREGNFYSAGYRTVWSWDSQGNLRWEYAIPSFYDWTGIQCRDDGLLFICDTMGDDPSDSQDDVYWMKRLLIAELLQLWQ